MIQTHLDTLKARIGEIVRQQELQAVGLLRKALGVSELEPLDRHRARLKVVTLCAVRTRVLYVDDKPVVQLREPDVTWAADRLSYQITQHPVEDLR